MTLDDLERLYELYCTKHASFGAYKENLNEYRPTLSEAKMYSQMTLVSRSISFMWISVRVPWGNRKRRFSVQSDAESSEP